MKNLIVIFIILILTTISYSIELKKPKQGFKKADLIINDWNPPSGLSAHAADGANGSVDPFYNLDINMGYLRLFTKSYIKGSDQIINNNSFPFIIEFKPFDFASFVNTGSSFSIYVERNEWIRNFTFIVSNKTFSSTQFVSSFMLWYGDLLSSSVAVKSISSQSPTGITTATTTLELLYLPTRRMGFGFSDRFHLYQTHNFALAMVLYFEMNLPNGRKNVLKNYQTLVSSPSTINYLENFSNSNRLTFAALAGLYLRYKKGDFNFTSSALYLRRQGDFDAWQVAQNQNTVLFRYKFNFNDRYIISGQYFMIQHDYTFLAEKGFSNIVSIGGEIRGMSKKLYWLGFALDLYFLGLKQERRIFGDYNGRFTGFHILPALNFYPLAFHVKNYSLKFSFIGSYIFARQKSSGIIIPGTANNVDSIDEGYSFMLRLSYDIKF